MSVGGGCGNIGCYIRLIGFRNIARNGETARIGNGVCHCRCSRVLFYEKLIIHPIGTIFRAHLMHHDLRFEAFVSNIVLNRIHLC